MSVSIAVPAGMALLLVISGFFSASETALFSLESVEVERRRKQRGLLGDSFRWCVDHARSVLVTILLTNLAANTLYFALAGYWAREAGGYVATAVTIGALVALVFLAEILPKSFALGMAGPFASFVAPVLRLWALLLTPLRLPLGAILDFLSRRVAPAAAKTRALSYDELEKMVKRDPERFGLGQRSADVIGELVGLSGQQVREVMVPFVDIDVFDTSMKVEEALDLALHKRWRWLLVEDRRPEGEEGGEQGNQLRGYVDLRDLLVADGSDDLGEHVRELTIVPELARLPHVLDMLRDVEVDRFLVVDEYGHEAGILGRDDLTESIVGGVVRGEHEDQDVDIRFRPQRGWEVPGGIGLREFEDLFSVDLPIARNRTLGGLLVEHLDRIPAQGERLTISGLTIEVVGVSRGRVHTLLVHFKEPPSRPADDALAANDSAARDDGTGGES